jgi:glycine oxidase
MDHPPRLSSRASGAVISILGAGVAGLCAATALIEAGHAVEVIERGPAPVSALAGGMLAPFCEGEAAPEIVVTRGARALDWWEAHVPGVVRQGTLVVAPPRDASELDRFARATRGHLWADPGALEPDLQGRFARGLFFAEEGHLDPVAALAALRHALIARGVAFHDGAPQGRIVDCRGIAGGAQGLRPVRGEKLDLYAPEVSLVRPVRLLHPRFPCYIVPRGAGRFMIGATMVESADPRGITARAVMELLSAAYALHPAFAEAEILGTATGLRPAFPDNIPALVEEAGVIHLNGLYRHGFLMAPALAQDLVQHLGAAHAD